MDLKNFRISRICEALHTKHCRLIVASSPANIFYLTGYHSVPQSLLERTQVYVVYSSIHNVIAYVVANSEIPCILEFAGNDALIFSYGGFQFAYGNKTNSITNIVENYCEHSFASPEEALAAAICHFAPKKVALDESRITYSIWSIICSLCPNVEFIFGSSIFMYARMVKHASEIDQLIASAKIAESSFMKMLSIVKAGRCEKDLESIFNASVCMRGAKPFLFVGAIGQRSAYSDTKCTSLMAQKGDIIRFDFGCIYEGYYSDLARTVVLGPLSDKKILKFYEAIQLGTQKAITAIQPGITAKEVYDIAMQYTKKHGIGDYHRLHCGHGIGLEVYDYPSIAPNDNTVLEKNMVLCIETPYYELGWGGIQIENTIVITDAGAMSINCLDDNIIII